MPTNRANDTKTTPKYVRDVLIDLRARHAPRSTPRPLTGCPMGCPPGYHEAPCTVGRPPGRQ